MENFLELEFSWGRFNNSSLLFAQGKTTLPTQGASVNYGIHLAQNIIDIIQCSYCFL